MKKNALLSILLALFLIICSFPTLAQPQPDDTNDSTKVKASLISEFSTIEPNKPFWVALHQKMTPEWHTYWDNPGDSGLKTTIQWKLPPGFKADEILWPTPHIEPYGPVINYGYSDEVTLLVKITPSPDLKEGQVVRIAADSTWLACKEICIPEQAENLFLKLVVKNGLPEPTESYQKFAQARSKLPLKLDLSPASTIEWPEEGKIRLTFATPDDSKALFASSTNANNVYFFPRTWGFLKHTDAQNSYFENNELVLETEITNGNIETMPHLNGVLVFETNDERLAYDVTLNNPRYQAPQTVETTEETQKTENTVENTVEASPALASTSAEPPLTLWGAIIFAFLGGLALNLMPCVFPVLSIKALSLVQQSHKSKRFDVFMGGFSYTLGILVSFAVLGSILIILQSGGATIGWGEQLQNPAFVLLMVYVLFLIGMMLAGTITIGSSLMGIGQNLTTKKGHAGDFFTGTLATIVATPCTAPFMGAAIFYALTQPWHITMIVLETLGLGLALPYLLLALFPSLLRFLPKPGAWMERFKQFLAFPMFGAAIWLVWVLAQSSGETGVLLALTGCLTISFGTWLWQHRDTHDKKGLWRTIKTILALCALGFALLFLNVIEEKITPVMCEKDFFADNHSAYGKPTAFSTQKLNSLLDQNKPVFVNMTAAWCITCLANDKVALSTDVVQRFMIDNQITYLKGDWTNRDEEITQYLNSFGRKGVPIYVYYPKGVAAGNTQPIVLPQLLTPSIVIDEITAVQE